MCRSHDWWRRKFASKRQQNKDGGEPQEIKEGCGRPGREEIVESRDRGGVWEPAAATSCFREGKRQKSRWWGGWVVKMKKQTTLGFLWRSGGWKHSECSGEALQRSMKRASIMQQLWIMGQHAEAVAQITGSEREERCAAVDPMGDPVRAAGSSTHF